MFNEKTDDRRARFSCILGARDHAGYRAAGWRLQIEAVRCPLDVAYYHLLTRCCRQHREKPITRAFTFLLTVACAHVDEHGRRTHPRMRVVEGIPRDHQEAGHGGVGWVERCERCWLGYILPQSFLHKFATV